MAALFLRVLEMVSKKTQYERDRRAGKVPKKPVGGRPGIKLSERHKEKIRTSQILNRLEEFVLDEEGDVEMAPHKVTAALGLLKKVMPDLASTHQTNGPEKSHEDWVDELAREAAETETEK